MQVDLGISRLLFAASGQAALRSDAGDPVQMARLANRYASEKLGLAPGRAPGAYVPVYKTTERMVEEAVFEKRDFVSTEGVFEDRAIVETRDVHETRAVYEDQAILETKVQGDKRLTNSDSLSEAEIGVGSAFTLAVGDGAAATVKFESSSMISVTVDGAVEQFIFNSEDGSFRAGLVNALSSIDGLSASLSAEGKLLLETTGGLSLTIADVAKVKGQEWAGSPLRKLGLTAGVATAEVTGYERVQTGTDEVVVGFETVTVGVERIKVGERSVVTGSGYVQTGIVSRFDGYDRELIGLEEPEIYGAGVLGLLGQLGSGGLPANYIEALFGRIDVDEERPAVMGFETEARTAYEETGRLADSKGELADPLGSVARSQPSAASSSADTPPV